MSTRTRKIAVIGADLLCRRYGVPFTSANRMV